MFQPMIYELQEWENIPVVVPRFVIYLSKYVKGISSFCANLRAMETTEDIKKKLEEYVKVSG